MRTLVTGVLVAGLVAAGATLAQPPEGKGRGGMMRMGTGGLALLTNPSVQEELKVTDEQKDKLKTFGEEFLKKQTEKRTGDRPNFNDPDFMKKMAEEMKKANAEGMKELAEAKLLKDEQMTRFKQIVWQEAGPAGTVADADVQKAVKLTGDQKDKLKSMEDEYNKDRMELMRSMRNDPEAGTKLTALAKEMKGKAVEVLTADQVKAWKELVGKEFTVKREGFGGRTGKGKGKPPEKKDPA